MVLGLFLKRRKKPMNKTNVCYDCDVEFSVETIYDTTENAVVFCPFCGTTINEDTYEDYDDIEDDIEDEDPRH